MSVGLADVDLVGSVRPITRADLIEHGFLDDYRTRLAAAAGYLLLISHDSLAKIPPDYWSGNNYRLLPASDHSDYSAAIPDAFVNGDIDTLLEGKLRQQYLIYLADWEERRLQLEAEIENLGKLEAKKSKAATTRDVLIADRSKLHSERRDLEREIRELQYAIDGVVDANRDLFSGDRNIADISVPYARVPKKHRKDRDFFMPTIKKKLSWVDAKKDKWLNSREITPYLHPLMVERLRKLYANETDRKAVEKIIGQKLLVISAARSPYKQATIRASGTYAAKMFGSGHVFGACVDFNGKKKWSGANHKKLRKIFAKYKIILPKRLATKDPNHAYLAEWENDKVFKSELQAEFLESYAKDMIFESKLIQAREKALRQRKKSLDGAISKLNNDAAKLIEEVKSLKSGIKKLKQDRSNKRRELTTKNQAAATFRSKRGKDRAQYRNRLREFETKAHRFKNARDYWERFDSIEFHASDGQYEISGRKWRYTNSDGEIIQGFEIDVQERKGSKTGGLDLELE